MEREIIQVIQDHVGVANYTVTVDSNLREDLGFDWLDFCMLAAELDVARVYISCDALAKCKTVQDVINAAI